MRSFEFNGKILSGQKAQAPLWRRCTQSTDAALGEAVGQDWVNANFPARCERKHESLLVVDLEKSLGQDIEGLDWMSPATKVRGGEEAAGAFRDKIGYPEDLARLQPSSM